MFATNSRPGGAQPRRRAWLAGGVAGLAVLLGSCSAPAGHTATVPSINFAICIDGRELFHLGTMLDELFRPENRLTIINWQKSYAPRGDNRHVSTATEYVLVYARDEARARTRLEGRTAVMDARYSSPDGDRQWKGGDLSGPGAKTHQKMVYAIQSPFTGELYYPPFGSCWRPEQKQVLAWMNAYGIEYVLRDIGDGQERAKVISLPDDQIAQAKAVMVKGSLISAKEEATALLKSGPWPPIYFGKKGTGRPQLKVYLEDVKQGKVPITYWAADDYTDPVFLGSASPHSESGHTQTGLDELDAIVGPGHSFDTVKPLKLFSEIVQLWCPPDGLVLDPFAESGTSGHAVLLLNKDSGSERRFILIEQGRPDRGDPYARSLMADRRRPSASGPAFGSPDPSRIPGAPSYRLHPRPVPPTRSGDPRARRGELLLGHRQCGNPPRARPGGPHRRGSQWRAQLPPAGDAVTGPGECHTLAVPWGATSSDVSGSTLFCRAEHEGARRGRQAGTRLYQLRLRP